FTLEGSSLLLSSPLGGVYQVRFSMSGCLRSEVKNLTATFQSGRLILSEPVAEYSGGEYAELCLFTFEGHLFLVSESNVASFRAAATSRGTGSDRPEELAYARLSAIP